MSKFLKALTKVGLIMVFVGLLLGLILNIVFSVSPVSMLEEFSIISRNSSFKFTDNFRYGINFGYDGFRIGPFSFFSDSDFEDNVDEMEDKLDDMGDKIEDTFDDLDTDNDDVRNAAIGGNATYGGMEFSVDDVDEIIVEVDVGTVEFVETNGDKIRILGSRYDESDLAIEHKNDQVILHYDDHDDIFQNDEPIFVIAIPSASTKTVDIEIVQGVGEIKVEGLRGKIDTLLIDTGVADVELDDVDIKTIDANTGVGAFELTYKSVLKENVSIKIAAFGEIEIDDAKSVGSVEVNSASATHELIIDAGMGSIDVDFE